MSATSDGAACRSRERKYRWKREKRNLFSDLDLKKKLNNHSCITTCRNGWGLLTSRHLPHDESRWSWERNSLGWTSANSCISRSQLVCPSPFEIINQSQHSSEPDRVIEHQPNRSNISYWLWCFFFFSKYFFLLFLFVSPPLASGYLSQTVLISLIRTGPSLRFGARQFVQTRQVNACLTRFGVFV